MSGWAASLASAQELRDSALRLAQVCESERDESSWLVDLGRAWRDLLGRWKAVQPDPPVPMILTCPMAHCGARHIDVGEFATKLHHTHACQNCGHVWRPAIVATVGVQFLPGFKDEAAG